MTDIGFCSFASGTWDWNQYDPNGKLIPGPVLVCDTHGQPASGEVYECAPGQERGLCLSVTEYVDQHNGFYGEDLIGRDVKVDRSRCRCGRPVDACHGHGQALAVLAHLAAETATAVSTTGSTPAAGCC